MHFSAAPLPAPPSLRLVFQGERPSLKVPFGLRAWGKDEDPDVVVLLERAAGSVELSERDILSQLPTTMSPGALCVLLGELRPEGLLGFLAPRAKVGRAARATALLAAGYTQLGGGVDAKTGQDLVWGSAP